MQPEVVHQNKQRGSEQPYFPNDSVGRYLAAFLVAIVLFGPEHSWPGNEPAAAKGLSDVVFATGFEEPNGGAIGDG